MRDKSDLHIERWTVDYCDGSELEEVILPHAWRQDVPVSFEGPVIYKTSIELPKTFSKLRFEGVSYAADVSIDGDLVASHRGIWDAFDIPLGDYLGSRVEISVAVTKNGGPTYPVNNVASGFLPYVFHTFGGMFGSVRFVADEDPLEPPIRHQSRVSTSDSKIFVDGKPFYCRGLLHWGWYPDLGHTNPPTDVIRTEVRAARSLGFNLVKFCLWIPPHQYFEVLKDEGMEAWIELPIWSPCSDLTLLEQMACEIERIVRQYRHHDNIVFWTLGCELGNAVPAKLRERLTRLVKNLVGTALVKDTSGGVEMYGGDPREYGDFYDFHPYCDTQFYPGVLDSLLPGPRLNQPMLLGEFNDADVHRDLAGLGNEIPFWASNLSELNDRGVRGYNNLPDLLRTNRFGLHPARENHRPVMESSRQKALFIRKSVQEAVRTRDQISGYVTTGWRDTPISTSGFFDDWETLRFSADECAAWNGSACIFVIPNRRPPWVTGGNRPGFVDPFNQFVGQILWKIGVHSDAPIESGLLWRVVDVSGKILVQGGGNLCKVCPLQTMEVAQIFWECDRPGEFRLEVEFGNARNSWPISVSEPFGDDDQAIWTTDDPLDLLGFTSESGNLTLTTQATADLQPGLMLLTNEGTIPAPFWRESAYEFRNSGFWRLVPFAEQWTKFLAISPDRVIDSEWLDSLRVPYEVLMRRIDVRNYSEDAVMVRSGDTVITTLRPFGGLGNQPAGIPNNPAGSALVRALGKYLG